MYENMRNLRKCVCELGQGITEISSNISEITNVNTMAQKD